MRNKLFSKVVGRVVVICMAIVMLFSVSFFGAGHCVMYDPRVAELQRRLEEMEEEARLQVDRIALYEHRVGAIVKLEDFVGGLSRHDYLHQDWVENIPRFFKDGIREIALANDIDEINNIVASVKYNIERLPSKQWGYSECGRFALGLFIWRPSWAVTMENPYLAVRDLSLRNIGSTAIMSATNSFIEMYPWSWQLTGFPLESGVTMNVFGIFMISGNFYAPEGSIYFRTRARIVFYINYVLYNERWVEVEVRERIEFYSGWSTVYFN